MRIGIDIDGVLADYQSGLRAFLEPKFDMELPEADSWGFDNWGLTSNTFKFFHTLFVSEGGFFDLEPLPESEISLRWLRQCGHEVVLITNRGQISNLSVARSDTIEWLDKYGFVYDELHFANNKANVVCDWYIDDSPEVLSNYASEGLKAIKMMWEYNDYIQVDEEFLPDEWPDIADWIVNYG